MGAWPTFSSLLLAALLSGCHAPVAVPVGVEVPVAAKVAFGYKLQATVTAYTSADVATVKLVLLTNDGGWRETGATKTIAAADLAAAISLGNLRAGRDYRVRADAYQADGTLISDAADSLTSFTTPAVTTVAGVDTVDDTTTALVSLRCKLADRTYAGTGTFVVAVSKGIEKKISHVRLTFSQVAADGTATVKQARTVALADAGQTFTMSNLRAGQAYKLLAEGLMIAGSETKASNDNNSVLTFTTPAVSGGSVDETVAATAYTVNCK